MATDPAVASRRSWLRNVTCATAVAAVPTAALAGAGDEKAGPRKHRPPTEAEKALGKALVPNGVAMWEWQVTAAPGLYFGAIPVIMRAADGHEFQLDIMRRDDDDPRRPVGVSGELAIYVVNGGTGRARTVENEGRGALALALYLDQVGRQSPPLMTLSERREIFRDGVFAFVDGAAPA